MLHRTFFLSIEMLTSDIDAHRLPDDIKCRILSISMSLMEFGYFTPLLLLYYYLSCPTVPLLLLVFLDPP